jgi:hypothetical protein
MYELVTQFSVDQQIQIVNTVGTWLAAFATTAAVIVSLYIAGRSERIANRPMLQCHINFGPDDPIYGFIGFEIENVGSGPAILLPMPFLIGGQHVGWNLSGEQSTALRRYLPHLAAFMVIHDSALLPPGHRRLLCWIPKDRYASPDLGQAIAALRAINVVIPYASSDGKVRMTAVRDEFNGDLDGLFKRFELPRKFKVPK